MASSISNSRSVPPPTHQEVTRKLSVHSSKPHMLTSLLRSVQKPTLSSVAVSGTESDSDSVFSPDVVSPSPMSAASTAGALLGAAATQPPLSVIAERGSGSGEESEEGTDDEEGGWRVEDFSAATRGSLDETVIKTGYLWKKGERRKTWKKRWFVLRPAHLAFYKTAAEYKLLRLLELTDIHSCTPVVLKKHQNTLGLVSPVRTFYLQAGSQSEVQDWVHAINEARTALLSTSTRNSVSAPIPIPTTPGTARGPSRLSSSPSHSPYAHQLTSSESDDGSPNPKSFPISSSATAPTSTSEAASPSKPVLSGYLMKCGSRRHNWHKRWFVLSGEKLIYSRSHMDTKAHRQIPLSMILDALEYDLPAHRNVPSVTSPSATSPPVPSSSSPDDGDATHRSQTFKIVTTKRTLLLCAPSEEEEIKWLSAIRALIARRSTQGVLPGDATPPVASPSAPGQLATSPSSGPAPTGRRRDSIVRRLSLSGGGPFGVGGPASNASPGGAGAQQEAASGERQS
ncbi:PH-domain-containing protein [Trametes versicolor FP-101664 SS1]|uniref:PH-domain-containing protein n=1 Tax=Trametes versicolor (strain FP-101664) TaxID=717944 RepID=UPI0004623792|nr:PH-domain-containing protein [Trametes versicolor FP-101664 SS1]EIW57280.1 PH-domain-containing protein [Trametes versicolor FP-101664 SS1]